MFQKKISFFLFKNFPPPHQAVPLQGAPCQGLDGSVQVGEVGPGRKIPTGACHALIRSAPLSLPGPRRQSRRGAPGAAVLLSHSPGVANGCRGARLQRARAEQGRKAQPGRGRSQRPRHQRQHCGNGAAARGPREDGRKGGAAPPDPRLPPPPPPPPFAPPARPGPPQPAAGLTCVADDDVLEEIGVRHGRGRSVPGSRLLLPLCASSAPSPAPLGREPGPRPPSVAVRASSKGRGAAGRTDSAERGSQRPSPSEQ